jgi:hypothetical protein
MRKLDPIVIYFGMHRDRSFRTRWDWRGVASEAKLAASYTEGVRLHGLGLPHGPDCPLCHPEKMPK